MTLQETLSLLFLMKNLYPRDKALDGSRAELTTMAEAWTEMLQDIPFPLGKAAVAAHAASSPYAPAISEIRAHARRMTSPAPLTAEEAWAIARHTMSRYGCSPYKSVATGEYPWERAKKNTPPEVWQLMERMGYQDMCRSRNVDMLRGQFIQAWERQQQRQAEQEQILPCLPDALRDKVLPPAPAEE